MLRASAVRRVALVVCVGSIAGMIVSSIGDNTGAALAFGLTAAVVSLLSMIATAVAPGARPVTADDEAARVEQLVREVVAQGAEEPLVRSLVRTSVRLGRAQMGSPKEK